MRYNIVKDADEILKNSKYLIKNPSNLTIITLYV